MHHNIRRANATHDTRRTIQERLCALPYLKNRAYRDNSDHLHRFPGNHLKGEQDIGMCSVQNHMGCSNTDIFG